MWFRDRGYQRGVELGPFPLESLAVEGEPGAALAALGYTRSERPEQDGPKPNAAAQVLQQAVDRYRDIFAQCNTNSPAPQGEGSNDIDVRAREVKGAAYYLDADHTGICALPDTDSSPYTHAIVVWVAYGREIETDNLAHNWIAGAEHNIAAMRATEICVSLMGHIRALGFDAECSHNTNSDLDHDALAIQAGIGVAQDGRAVSPFFGTAYANCVVLTSFNMATDTPLSPQAKPNALAYWWGINGARSGREQRRQTKRRSDMSRYPMEQVKRVEAPTTLIFEDEVPRVPKRAEFFMRARMGDLGAKAQREVQRFAFKHPLTDGMMLPLRSMVPHQDGDTAASESPGFDDAEANTRAIKSLSYHLGADLTGVCRIPDYAWYSHGPDGKPVEINHKYAVVMLIDQGYDTMEGASGDDWISGCQSMRGYIRGAEIAGVMADFLRGNGISARPQTNADSQVLQIPLVLLAGLGELSRIGELVLNPYVGPRFKSVVLTTNLPLVPDKPIDFGLQTFCSNCLKCARECPVNAIPFGDKVMFNGYEIWKPDVERCTRYRVTNPKGSACGRCMKTCPLNKVVTADGALAHRIGTWFGVNARWLKKLMVPVAVYLDDALGYGTRNPVKRWWQDLELIDGVAKIPSGTNERDIDLAADVSGNKSPVGYYHAADMPAPDTREPVLANHKQAIQRADKVETVAAARQRRSNGQPAPEHYIPTKTLD